MSEVKRYAIISDDWDYVESPSGGFVDHDDYAALEDECERLRGEISDLHTTMMAAAVEIQAHWAAHCDEEGYGPANLMHRLENGIAAQYGYTAQTLVQLQAEREQLRQQLAERDAQIERLQMQLAACGEHVYCFPDCKSAHEAVSKEQAVPLWYEGFRSEPIPVLEAWEAIGHDIGCNPSKQELLDSLRNMAAICEAHGNDMPKPAQHARDSAELRRLCAERDYLKACQENAQLHITGLVAERNAALRQRDKLAELLREAKAAYTTAIHWTDMRATMAKIDTAVLATFAEGGKV